MCVVPIKCNYDLNAYLLYSSSDSCCFCYWFDFHTDNSVNKEARGGLYQLWELLGFIAHLWNWGAAGPAQDACEGIVIVEHLADKKNGNFPSELVETKAKLERYWILDLHTLCDKKFKYYKYSVSWKMWK